MNEYKEEFTHKGFKFDLVPDYDPPNPREEWDNLGTMFCRYPRCTLGDKNADDPRDLARDDIAAILNLRVYERGITMSCSEHGLFEYPYNDRWDSPMVGWIYVTKEKARKEFGWKRITKARKSKLIQYLKNEVEAYDQCLTGDCWIATAYDADGEMHDSCRWLIGHDYARQIGREMAEEARVAWIKDRDALAEELKHKVIGSLKREINLLERMQAFA